MARLLRFIAVLLLGLTAAFTILSGVGTTCVALAAEKYGASMAPLAPYRWLYGIFVLVTVAVGVFGGHAVVYATTLTLAVFLALGLPGVRRRIDFTAYGRDAGPMGGAAAILVGLLAHAIHALMAPTHTWGGVNYAAAFDVSMRAAGWAFILLGLGGWAWSRPGVRRQARRLLRIAA